MSTDPNNQNTVPNATVGQAQTAKPAQTQSPSQPVSQNPEVKQPTTAQETGQTTTTPTPAPTPEVKADSVKPTTQSDSTTLTSKDKESKSEEKPKTKEEEKQTMPGADPNIQKISKPKDGSELNIIELLNYVIKQALKAQTSDVHIEGHEELVVVRFRIDGILRDVLTISKQLHESLLFRIKVAAKLRTDEHFAPQDGRISFKIDKIKVDTRVSILPTTNGEKVVMRLLSKEGKVFTLEALGFNNEDLDMVEKAYNRPYGMILTVGPTGSGKTTTLYSVLKLLNARDVNITTVEDPVEYNLEGVNHVQINVKANMTFASGLRSILRQDPDIIMIGEIRDSETASIATNAALTGHLVLSTLHTNDSISSIPRLIDMGVEPFLVATTVNLIMAQRLARKLCECKQEFIIDQPYHDVLHKMRPDLAELLKVGTKVYKEKTDGSCEICEGAGFKGRTGLYEILPITEEMRKMIAERENIDKVFQFARKQGLRLIVEHGVLKVSEGETSIEEIMRVTALRE